MRPELLTVIGWLGWGFCIGYCFRRVRAATTFEIRSVLCCPHARTEDIPVEMVTRALAMDVRERGSA